MSLTRWVNRRDVEIPVRFVRDWYPGNVNDETCTCFEKRVYRTTIKTKLKEELTVEQSLLKGLKDRVKS